MARARLIRIGSSLLSSLVLQARNLVISVVVFRLFADPKELWGTVNHVAAIVTLLSLPAKFGLEFTAVQFVSKYRDDAPKAALEAFWVSSFLRVALTMLVGGPMLLAPGLVGDLLGLGGMPELVRIGGLLLISTSLYEYGSFLLSGTDNFVAMMTGRLVYAVVNIVGIALVAWGWREDAAGPILMAQVAGGVGATVWSLWSLWREARGLAARPEGVQDGPAPPTGREMLKAILVFSVPMTLVSVATQLFSYLDRVMIPVLSDVSELGSYAVANSIIGAALFGTYAFRNVARTRLPGLLRRDAAEAQEVLLSTYRACFVVAVWIAAGTLAVAPDLLSVVYGAEADDAAGMLRWFVPFVLLSAHANFSATALVAADRPRVYAWLMGALSVANFGLNLMFIPLLGGYGAILASTLSLVPLTLIAYRLVATAYGPALWSVQAMKDAVPSTLRISAMGLVAAGVGWMCSAPTAVAAVGAGVLVSAVFAGLLAVSGELRALRAAM